MNSFAFISAFKKDGHKHVIRFDSESMPLVREKLADLIGDGVIDEDAGVFLWKQACLLKNEMDEAS